MPTPEHRKMTRRQFLTDWLKIAAAAATFLSACSPTDLLPPDPDQSSCPSVDNTNPSFPEYPASIFPDTIILDAPIHLQSSYQTDTLETEAQSFLNPEDINFALANSIFDSQTLQQVMSAANPQGKGVTYEPLDLEGYLELINQNPDITTQLETAIGEEQLKEIFRRTQEEYLDDGIYVVASVATATLTTPIIGDEVLAFLALAGLSYIAKKSNINKKRGTNGHTSSSHDPSNLERGGPARSIIDEIVRRSAEALCYKVTMDVSNGAQIERNVAVLKVVGQQVGTYLLAHFENEKWGGAYVVKGFPAHTVPEAVGNAVASTSQFIVNTLPVLCSALPASNVYRHGIPK